MRKRPRTAAPTRGFTLIELLVVIAIIGMLASVVLASMSGVRERTRDTRRLQDLRNIQTALELYYTDNKHYPYSCSTNVWTSFDSSQYSVNQLCSTLNGATPIGTLSQVMAPYIGRPTDPKNLGGDSGYLYINQRGANDYCILIWRTPENLNNFPQRYWYNTAGGRCTAISADGQCTAAQSSTPHNEIFFGQGAYVNGC